MVQVQVRIQQVLYRKLVLLNVAGEGLFLLLASGTRVNQNGVAGIVT